MGKIVWKKVTNKTNSISLKRIFFLLRIKIKIRSTVRSNRKKRNKRENKDCKIDAKRSAQFQKIKISLRPTYPTIFCKEILQMSLSIYSLIHSASVTEFILRAWFTNTSCCITSVLRIIIIFLTNQPSKSCCSCWPLPSNSVEIGHTALGLS